jgi:hypothetical protein
MDQAEEAASIRSNASVAVLHQGVHKHSNRIVVSLIGCWKKVRARANA